MLYQKFDKLTHPEDRQAYILQDPSMKVLSPELRQLVLDLADHSPFISWPFKPTPEQRTQSRELGAICEDLRAKIIALHGPGKIVVPVSKDFAYFLHIHMASDNDDSGYYRRYPDEDKLVMEPGEFIPMVQYPPSKDDSNREDICQHQFKLIITNEESNTWECKICGKVDYEDFLDD